MTTLARTAIQTPRRVLQLRHPITLSSRTIITLKDHKVGEHCFSSYQRGSSTFIYQYTAHATAHGEGRNGEVESKDGRGLKLRLSTPKSLGGPGDGSPNPEQLFAMGYSGAQLV
jgi:hypothetical protein